MMQRKKAFTLVELLVVIGIIALLVSMLLPTLNKARAAANSTVCESKLRQIGQALTMYGNENKGLAPWGGVWLNQDGSALTSPFNNQGWTWVDTISIRLGTPAHTATTPDGMENQVDQANKIFLDSDTIDWLPTWASYGYNNHYTANLRYMPQAGYPDWGADNSGNTYFHQHKANVPRGASVMIVWDAGQRLDSYEDGRADPISWSLDNWQSNWGHSYLAPVPGYSYFNVQSYGIPIELGDPSLGNNSLAGQKSANQDLTVNAWRGPAMRFRHIKNTVMNALYADGHVEPKHLGEVMVRDVCMNR